MRLGRIRAGRRVTVPTALVTGIVDLALFSSILPALSGRGGVPRTPDVVALPFDVLTPPFDLIVPIALGALQVGILLGHRHRTSSGVAALCQISAVTTLTCDYRPVLPLLLAWYRLAASAPSRRVRVAAAMPLLTSVAWTLDELHTGSAVPTVFNATVIWAGYLVVLGLVTVAGRATYQARRRTEAAGRARDRAVRSERLRMARELHDVVVHAVTMMTLQAEVGRSRLPHDPEAAAAAMSAITHLGGQAVDELRSMLTVLRPVLPEPPGTFGPPSPEPPAALDDLLEHARRAGLTVTLPDDAGPVLDLLPPSQRLAVRRLVQEGLTNTLKHSGVGSTARISLSHSAIGHAEGAGRSEVVVEVSDDGAGERPGTGRALSTGLGLIGLGERAALLGGTLEAGPRPDGGFTTRLRFPGEVPRAGLTIALPDAPGHTLRIGAR